MQAFIEAVQNGDIWWHAMPHNAELEFMDRSMLQASIQLTHELDAAFGMPPKITMSQVNYNPPSPNCSITLFPGPACLAFDGFTIAALV